MSSSRQSGSSREGESVYSEDYDRISRSSRRTGSQNTSNKGSLKAASSSRSSSVKLSGLEKHKVTSVKDHQYASDKNESLQSNAKNSSKNVSSTSSNKTVKGSTNSSSISSYTESSTSKRSTIGKKMLEEIGMEDSGLSTDEMRKRLFASFKSRGVLDNVRTQLRANLASALTKESLVTKGSKPQPESLFTKISDILVAEHLKQSQFDYTLSIFKTESLVGDQKLIPSELLRIMRVKPGSKKYNDLSILLAQRKSGSFLWNFISHICDDSDSDCAAVGCQTEEHSMLIGNDIGKEMSRIESEVYMSARDDILHRSSLEERLNVLQRKLEEQKRKELHLEKEKFKDTFMREFKLTEKERSKVEIDRYKSEIEKSYRDLFNNLKEKERETNDMLVRKQQQLEQESYSSRQNILREIDALKDRELEFKRVHELAMQSVRTEEARLKVVAEELNVKELSLKAVEEKYDCRLKEEILKLKLEHQDGKDQHDMFYRSQEAKLQEEKRLFEYEKQSLMHFKSDCEKLDGERKQLQSSLNLAMQKISILNQKSENMKEKLREVADYSQVKEKLVLSKKEVEFLKTRINEITKEKELVSAEHRKHMKEILASALKGSPEVDQLQNQLILEKEEFAEKEVQLKEKLMRTEGRLNEERARNNELMHMYETCLLQNKSLRREIEDLKAVRKMVPAPRGLSGSKNFIHESVWKETKTPSNVTFPHKDSTGKSLENNSPDQSSNTKFFDDSFKLSLDEPKEAYNQNNRHIFERLEREAVALEETYRSYKSKQLAENPVSLERPNTNDYRPLQKYYSTVHEDATENALDSKIKKLTDSKSNLIRNESFLEEKDHSVARGKENSELRSRESTSNVVKGRESHQKFLDTWNGDRLTEQLLESAVVNKDGVATETNLESRLETLKSFKDEVKDPDLAFAESRIFQEEKESRVMPGETTEGQLNKDLLASQPISPSVNDISVHSELDPSLKYEEINQERDDGLFKHEYVQNIHSNDQDFGKKNDRAFGQDEKQNDMSSQKFLTDESAEENVITEETAKVDKEKLVNDIEKAVSDRSEIQPNFIHDGVLSETSEIVEGSLREASIKSGNSIIDQHLTTDEVNTGEGDEIENVEPEKSESSKSKSEIDPLMKHYMEMLLKRKEEEKNTTNEKEEEKDEEEERVNLTDDIKLESRMSKSDFSELAEDRIEDIENDSGDDFNW